MTTIRYIIAAGLLSAPLTAWTAPKVEGLVCDALMNGQSFKVRVEIEVKGKKARLAFRNAMSIRSIGQMTVEAKDIKPILSNNAAGMDRKSVVDKSNGTTIEFRIDGYSFDQKPRLGAIVSGEGLALRLQACNIVLESTATPF